MARRQSLAGAIGHWVEDRLERLSLEKIIVATVGLVMAGTFAMWGYVVRIDNDNQRVRERLDRGGCCEQHDCDHLAAEIEINRGNCGRTAVRLATLEVALSHLKEELERLRGKHGDNHVH